MIAVDTSALVALIQGEPRAADIAVALASADEVLMSTVTTAEALVVAERRGAGAVMAKLIERLGCTFIDVSPATPRRMGGVYARWGKGVPPASLNFGDCFAYDVAEQHAGPLLFVGADFSKTDIRSVL